MPLKYILELTNPLSVISLPQKISGITKLRVNKVRYVTASLQNKYMIVDIKGWNDNSWFFDGNRVIPMTCFMILPPTNNTMAFYETTGEFDAVKSSGVGSLANFTLELLIDGQYSNDINPSNPVYVEIFVE